jgi:glycerol kinase
MGYILVIDEGTTSTRAMLFNEKMQSVSVSQKRFKQYFPKPGWVEHDAEEIYANVEKTICEAIQIAGIKPSEITSIGITNQRETIVPFDKKTGKPTHRAIVWQCRRTADMIKKLKEDGIEAEIHKRTGLFLDPYFSGSKIRYLKENIPETRSNTYFGTIDAFLVYRLTGGKSFKTDPSNASRTLLFNINAMQYDPYLMDIFSVKEDELPLVSASNSLFGKTKGVKCLPDGIPITGILGDQQSALLGQGGFVKGVAKNTYGTGSFLLVNTGDKPVFFDKGILTTVAFKIDKVVNYAVEGSIFIVGALIDWLVQVGLLRSIEELNEILSESVVTDVYFVPAFTGLGAPYWDPDARGAIFNLTRGTQREDIVRAAILSIPLQTEELLRTMKENGIEISEMRVDGGVSNNDFIMQLQANISALKILRQPFKEITAKGAALISALGSRTISFQDINKFIVFDKEFVPQMNSKERENIYRNYLKFIDKVKSKEV